MTAAPLLAIRDLQVVLRLDDGVMPILDGIDLDLAPGKVLALVGESGSGKSVTAQAILRILPRALQLAGGAMLLRSNGAALDLAASPPTAAACRASAAGEIAMIFQEPMSSFSPLHTIGNQVGEVLRIHERLSKQAARQRTIELLDQVGIPNPARRGRPLSLRVLRRHAPAGDDRQGAVLQSVAAAGGRADDRARRHHPGPDPDAHARPAGRVRHGHPVHHP